MDERTAEIISECKAIIEGIEGKTAPLSRIALRARRLAQLLDDDAAVMWLSLECSGPDRLPSAERRWKSGDKMEKGADKWVKLRAAPDLVSLETLTQVITTGRKLEQAQIMAASLASLEAQRPLSKEDEREIASQHGGAKTLLSWKVYEHVLREVLERVAVAIHEWATNVYVVHRFRQQAGNIFERFKAHADVALARVCPDAIAKLTHAVERAGSDNAEEWAAAVLSCRRVLRDFADVVYPPRDEPVDGRKVGTKEYKNRLWAFAKERGSKAIARQFLATEEIEGLCKSLDRVYELDSKGVHDSVTKHESHVAVLRTYILLEQLGQLDSDSSSSA